MTTEELLERLAAERRNRVQRTLAAALTVTALAGCAAGTGPDPWAAFDADPDTAILRAFPETYQVTYEGVEPFHTVTDHPERAYVGEPVDPAATPSPDQPYYLFTVTTEEKP